MDKHEAIDSTQETLKHIQMVGALLARAIDALAYRAIHHDESKLATPEKEVFDRATQRLYDLTYGSPEYKTALSEMHHGLMHHYLHNRHHPEHHNNGVDGMTLIDLLEMICDWMAATKRHGDGDIRQSLEVNKKRFRIDRQLSVILANTVVALEGDASDKTNGG